MKTPEERAQELFTRWAKDAPYVYVDDQECILEAAQTIREAVDEALAAAAPRWIPVTERLPPRRTTVLVFGMYAGDPIITDERWDGRWYEHSDGVITHWMPLPAPPDPAS